MTRAKGMLPGAWNAYLLACKAANLPPENVVQTVGDAPLSAGFHLADGTFTNESGANEHYCAAADFSVLHPTHLGGAQMSALLLAMFHGGWVPFWRHEGVFMNGPHCHAVWPACKMKPELQSQVHDFLNARNGLAGHGFDTFWSQFIHQAAWEIGCQNIRTMFLAHNPPQ